MAGRRWRWWFENRGTGEVTIAQFPNWPLWAIAGCWVGRRLATDEGSALHDGLGWAIHGLWLIWGGDELLRGVNPWRWLLGAAVVAWQVTAIATNVS